MVGGCEYAGVVVALGPDCKRLQIGDRVCGVQDPMKMQGTWAEQTVATENNVVSIPADISFVAAAAVGMSFPATCPPNSDMGGLTSETLGAGG